MKPGRSAACLSGMPGPLSLTRTVLPPSRMVMMTPAKEAWTRLLDELAEDTQGQAAPLLSGEAVGADGDGLDELGQRSPRRGGGR